MNKNKQYIAIFHIKVNGHQPEMNGDDVIETLDPHYGGIDT